MAVPVDRATRQLPHGLAAAMDLASQRLRRPADGSGLALTPGGNDALVLYGIPSLSPHALPAFLAMALGVAFGLLIMRACFGIEMRVACRKAESRSEEDHHGGRDQHDQRKNDPAFRFRALRA